MQALNVLHSESSRGWGGQEVRILKEMIALRGLGHNVELVCPADAALGIRSDAEGFKVHHARMRGGADVRSMLTIRSLATYNWIPHRVVAVSHYVRNYLISAGVPASRVETIHDGIVKPEPLTHSTLRDELELDSNAVVAGIVAVLRGKKGHEDLIAAVRPMMTERANLHVVIAGEGEEFDKPKLLIEAFGLARRIHLLGFRKDVNNVLRGCDRFVLPTHQEALGQAFIEAMAMGLPVIGTHVDGVPELIDSGVNGLLVPARDVDALRGALTRLVDDAPLHARFGLASRIKTENNFTLEGMAGEPLPKKSLMLTFDDGCLDGLRHHVAAAT